MTQIRKDKNITLPRVVADKLKELSEKSGFSQTEILTQWIEAIYPFVEKHDRVSMVTVVAKSGFYCGSIPLYSGAFPSPITESDSEADRKMWKAISEQVEKESEK